MIERLIARSTGFLGELLVADRLQEMGFQTMPAPPGASQSDILAISPSGREFSIEVKTLGTPRGTFFLGSKVPDPRKSDFWILVNLERQQNELPQSATYHIYTVDEFVELFNDSPWNQAQMGQSRPSYDIRNHEMEKRPAVNAWSKLPD